MTSNSTPANVAVVTGASSGIGAATARALAADGYRVALLARRLDRITTLADELGNGSIAIEADVTDRDSIVAAADRVRQELGTAGVLINDAGVMLLGPFGSGQRADYRQMIEATKPEFVIAFGRHCDMPEIFRFLVGAGVPFVMEKPWGPIPRPSPDSSVSPPPRAPGSGCRSCPDIPSGR